MVYRHYPIQNLHADAYAAATAAECAADQGRFKEYHDVLFRKQARLGARLWADFAREAGAADKTAFNDFVRRDAHGDRIRADIAAGDKLDVRGTPTLIINGTVVRGDPGIRYLETALRQAR